MIKDKKYIFSVIIAIHNSELWLRNTIESVINQSIGFNNIQLILVDDSSSDSSLKICQEYKSKYKDNIEIIVNKKNKGVSFSRNRAIKYIKGQYVEFLDSDDFLSKTVLEDVNNFFTKHNAQIDIVSIPMYYFEGRTDEHYLNTKFKYGNRIIDLKKDYKDVFVHINSIFIKSNLIKQYKFDESLVTCEDGKMAIQLLLEKQKYGVINSCRYNYRLRIDKKDSLSQIAKNNKDWYIKQLINYPLWIYEYCNSKLGYIPNFVKYMIACHLQWRFKSGNNNKLREIDNKIYNYLLLLSIQYIDDYIIDELTKIPCDIKEYIKSLKIN